MQTFRRTFAASAAAVLVALAGTPASAQDALGDGTALDNNLREGVTNVNASPLRIQTNALGQRTFDSPGAGRALDHNLETGSGGFNSPGRAGNMRAELAFRNAIVTGNAPGGRSFRGNVGYTASNDFRGVTGSDSTFRFERDSFYSGLATRNLRGVGAIQYQFGQTTGSQVEGFDQRTILRRPAAGVDALEVRSPTTASETQGIDPFGYLGGSMRSTTSFATRSAEFPSILGQVSTREGSAPQAYLTASPLGGLKAYSGSSPMLGLTPEIDPRTGTFVNPARDGESEATRAIRENLSVPLNERITSGATYGDLMQSLRERSSRIDPRTGDIVVEEGLIEAPADGRERAEPAEAPPNPFDQLIEDLRDQLANPDRAVEDDTEEEDGNGEAQEERFIEHPDGTRTPMANPVKPHDPAMARSEVERLIQRARELLAEAPVNVESLVTDPEHHDPFTAHMKRGQELLTEGRWFEAEERFSAALRTTPGDPMAAAGRVNAQIGAGMFVSAAVNLRNLLKGYPELMNARFDSALLPQGDRLNAIRAQLRDRCERDSGIARDAGLLLAYLGHQTGNPDDVRDGFATVRRMARTSPDDAPAFDELERLLIALWERP